MAQRFIKDRRGEMRVAKGKSVVCVFDDNAPLDYCGSCRGGWVPFGDPSKTLQESVQDLAVKLKDIFGDAVTCKFVDIKTEAIKDYPEIEKNIHQVFLPMTVIDGIPRLHGFLDHELIVDTVRQHLHDSGK